MEDRLLTPEQVAARLAVSPKSIREWLKSQKLKGTKMGRLWRVREDDLRRFLDAPQKLSPVPSVPNDDETRRREAVIAARGCLSHLPGSVDAFLRRKHEEVEEEERRWEDRHRQ